MQKILRRRRFIVNRKLQVHLLLYSLSYAGALVIAMGLSLFGPLVFRMWTTEIDSYEAFQSSTQFLYLHARFWPIGMLLILCIGMHSILNSHRIAGPLFRLRRTLDEVRAGELRPTYPARRGDLIAEDIDDANRSIDILRERMSEIQDAYEELDQAIQENIATGLAAPGSAIAKKGRRLGEAISFFRVHH